MPLHDDHGTNDDDENMPRKVAHVDLPEPPELGPLTEQSLEALRSLAAYRPAPGSEPCPDQVPAYRRAAVLLSIFPGRSGDLYVILSQRATALRSHGGDTAIPGGRFEANDQDLEATAVGYDAWRQETGLTGVLIFPIITRDERHGKRCVWLTSFPLTKTRLTPALWLHPQTGLPIDPKRAPKLCELEPFLSANELLVTPIVVLIIDPLIKVSRLLLHIPCHCGIATAYRTHLQPKLNPLEVSLLFSLPLASFLYHQPPNALRQSLRLGRQPTMEELQRQQPKSEFREPSDWHTCRDIRWLGHRVRRHTFWDTRNPIRGLTSDILIHAAAIAYARQPDFSTVAPTQPSQAELIRTAFTGPMAIKKRRVRPRMAGLQQPVDDDGKRPEDKAKLSRERTLDMNRWMTRNKATTTTRPSRL